MVDDPQFERQHHLRQLVFIDEQLAALQTENFVLNFTFGTSDLGRVELNIRKLRKE